MKKKCELYPRSKSQERHPHFPVIALNLLTSCEQVSA